MTLGFVMLCHTALDRAAQVARFWAAQGCPVVIHVDKRVPDQAAAGMAAALADLPLVRMSKRFPCEWGTWSIVEATLAASTLILSEFPDVRHVFLASGSCIPLRPVEELRGFLQARPQTDFIESVVASEAGWTTGGLDQERFTLRFPFSWRKRRGLFDRYVEVQRRLGLRRRIPHDLTPHLGSQWWCLTRQTLSAILTDPNRAAHERYFRHVWIPDESYFQTLVRNVSTKVESRALTLSKFDPQGRPHIFYDDHLQLLRRTEAFVARKVWPHADRLYGAFLAPDRPREMRSEPPSARIDAMIAKAAERRMAGRPGLFMQSRFPSKSRGGDRAAGPYSVLQGFSDVFEGFEDWLSKVSGARVHGHLFAAGRAEFADGETVFRGGLSDNPRLRDYNPRSFLTNLVWNARGERQCFQFGPGDVQAITSFLRGDPHAEISVISGAFLVPLYLSNRDIADIRVEAATLQRAEAEFLALLGAAETKARVRVRTLAEFAQDPMAMLQEVVDDASPRAPRWLTEVPRMADLSGFPQFLQNLRNHGMQPARVGDFSVDPAAGLLLPKRARPYVVK